MAQRNQPRQPKKKGPTAKGSTKSSAASAKALSKAGNRPAGSSQPPTSRGPAAGGPPNRKPGKSIVNQRQTPWGLIAVVVVLVVFAGAIVAYAVTRHHAAKTDAWTRPEIAAAKAIPGLRYKAEPNHTHVTGTVKYNTSPPTGGNHNGIWALCDGVVYDHQIANENAVHMLEHGTVWITYNPATLKAGDLATLKTKVEGIDRTALSPYKGLQTPISLQAWNYQLFVNSASDKRIDEFIDALRANPKTTPENASCSGDGFQASQSYPGHPYNG